MCASTGATSAFSQKILITRSQYVCVYVRICTLYMFIGSCLATKVFIGNLPAMGWGWVII